MPLVQIDAASGWSEQELPLVGDAVQAALVAELDVPQHDRFQLRARHDAGSLDFDRGYVGRARTDRFLLVRVTLSAGRSTDAKQRFYRRLLDELHGRVAMEDDDLAVVLQENAREDWSFGGGLATYLTLPAERWT